MTRQLIIRPEADLDVEEAAAWYEDQRAGLGFRFLSELGQILERIVESPLQFPEIEEGARRGLLHRFPYGVYFVSERERVVVLAVLHLHRHPETWKVRR